MVVGRRIYILAYAARCISVWRSVYACISVWRRTKLIDLYEQNAVCCIYSRRFAEPNALHFYEAFRCASCAVNRFKNAIYSQAVRRYEKTPRRASQPRAAFGMFRWFVSSDVQAFTKAFRVFVGLLSICEYELIRDDGSVFRLYAETYDVFRWFWNAKRTLLVVQCEALDECLAFHLP